MIMEIPERGWKDWPAEPRLSVEQAIRRYVLHAAADKLDAQASDHGEGIHDYTDLLRVWAANDQRWEDGA